MPTTLTPLDSASVSDACRAQDTPAVTVTAPPRTTVDAVGDNVRLGTSLSLAMTDTGSIVSAAPATVNVTLPATLGDVRVTYALSTNVTVTDAALVMVNVEGVSVKTSTVAPMPAAGVNVAVTFTGDTSAPTRVRAMTAEPPSATATDDGTPMVPAPTTLTPSDRDADANSRDDRVEGVDATVRASVDLTTAADSVPVMAVSVTAWAATRPQHVAGVRVTTAGDSVYPLLAVVDSVTVTLSTRPLADDRYTTVDVVAA